MVWIIILTVVGASGLWWAMRTKVQVVEAATVSVQRQGSQSLPILSASGYVAAHQQVIVGAKTPGRVVKILVDEGDRVETGALMAELEAFELKAGVARAEAEFEDAERQRQRYQNLWKERIVAKGELDRVETTYKVAKAALELHRAQLENMMIRAPFSGTVLKKYIEVGQMLTAGAGQDGGISAFTLADLDRLDVDVDVSESNIQKISHDHPAEVVAEALSDMTFRGRVIKIASTANRQKAIVEVTVRILEGDARLKPEMSVKVTFVEREAPAAIRNAKPRVLAPKAAVLNDGDKRFVWVLVVEGKYFRAKRNQVECRKEWTEYWEVTKGLAGGEQVVTGGFDGLKEGQLVKIKEK